MSNKKRLSAQTTSKLILEVKKHPHVWNPSDPAYHDRHQVSLSWKEISKQLGDIPVDTLRAKWKNLRDVFVKIMKRHKLPDEYNGGWRYFKELLFIYRPEDEVSDESDENVEFETLYNEENHISEVNVKMEDEEESSDEDPIKEKRRKVENDDENYDMMFLKSLAPYFKQLDEMRKLVVRSKMQDMLMNELAAQRSEGFRKMLGDV